MLKQPRAHAFLVVPLLALTLFLVGCPKRPATTVAVAPAPAAPTPAPAAPAPAPAPAMPAPAAPNLVLIEGNCDERGTAEYNLALGEKRAKAAMNYLVAQGIQASRVTIISYGKERPVCTEKSEACWAQNRRDNFLTKTR